MACNSAVFSVRRQCKGRRVLEKALRVDFT